MRPISALLLQIETGGIVIDKKCKSGDSPTWLIVMWKAINNMFSLPIPDHVIQKQRVTWQFHPNKFIQLLASRSIYKYNFVSRTLKVWNNLSNDIIKTTTLNTFKRAVSEIDIDLE